MPLALILAAGGALYLAGNAAEKTGDASLKIAVGAGVILLLYLKVRK